MDVVFDFLMAVAMAAMLLWYSFSLYQKGHDAGSKKPPIVADMEWAIGRYGEEIARLSEDNKRLRRILHSHKEFAGKGECELIAISAHQALTEPDQPQSQQAPRPQDP